MTGPMLLLSLACANPEEGLLTVQHCTGEIHTSIYELDNVHAAMPGLERGGQALVISPAGFALAAAELLVDDDSVELWFTDGNRVEAQVVRRDEELALLRYPSQDPTCFPIRNSLPYERKQIWSPRLSGAPVQGSVTDRSTPGVLVTDLPAPTEPGEPVLYWNELGGVRHMDGPTTAITAEDLAERLDFDWRHGDPGPTVERLAWWKIGSVAVALLTLGFVLIRALGKYLADDDDDDDELAIRGSKSGEERPLPHIWVDAAEDLGLEVHEDELSGEIDGFAVRVSRLGSRETCVKVRIDPPFDLQVVHADRSGNVQEPIDLHNPVLDSLIAVGGEPGAVALFDDEDFVGPLLEVVHRHPASSVDDEGVTLRAEGLGELAAALGRALELASALRRLQ